MSVNSGSRYWYVFRTDGKAPHKKHTTVGSATTEAKRLSKANPGSTFIVAEARFEFTGEVVTNRTDLF